MPTKAQPTPRGSIVTHETNYRIRPEDLDTTVHPMDSFGNYETEISARWVVQLCQELGGWIPFSDQQIEDFYNRGGHQGFTFNQLVYTGLGFYIQTGHQPVGGGWIVKGDDGLYRVTDDFILRYYKSAPVR